MDYQNSDQLGGATKWIDLNFKLSDKQKQVLRDKESGIVGLDSVRGTTLNLLIEDKDEKTSIGYWSSSGDVERQIKDILSTLDKTD